MAPATETQTMPAWLLALRADDARYPRPRRVAALRWIVRLWWAPVSVLAGTAASNLVTSAFRHGPQRLTDLAALTAATLPPELARALAHAPALAVALLAAASALFLLERALYFDMRREAAVQVRRDMRRLEAAMRKRLTTTAAVRDEVGVLTNELEAILQWLPGDGDWQTHPAASARERAGRLAGLVDALAWAEELKRLMDEVTMDQMRAWERQQQAFMRVIGAATVVIGIVAPLLYVAA